MFQDTVRRIMWDNYDVYKNKKTQTVDRETPWEQFIWKTYAWSGGR